MAEKTAPFKRPSWDTYFIEIAGMVASRSTCLRRKVGAIIVKDKRILSTGYNGVPTGIKHCLERGCLRDELQIPSGQRHELCMGLHAEQNAIIQAALYGVSIENATFYITHQPCVLCAKMMINARVKEVVFCGDYPDDLAQQIFQEAKIKVRKFTGEEK